MSQAFNHILTFLFKHRYFSENLFKSVEITFGEETSKLLRNLDIIIKPFPGGLHMLASNPNLFEYANEIPVRLYLNSKDPLFINYTELPDFNPAGNLLYFNNLSVNTNSDSLSLHSNEFAGQNEVVGLSTGKIMAPKFEQGLKYRFTDVLGNTVPSQNLIQSANSPGEFMLNNMTEGLIRVKPENEPEFKLYYNPKTVWRKPLGIIEIFPDTLFKHYNVKGKVDYNLNFNNRKTIWKYFLVGPVYQKFENLSIINKSKEQVFNALETQQINENHQAVVFESKSRLPISEHSEDSFQLVEDFDPELKYGKVILKNLPNASSELIYRDEAKSNETIYSHIYI